MLRVLQRPDGKTARAVGEHEVVAVLLVVDEVQTRVAADALDVVEERDIPRDSGRRDVVDVVEDRAIMDRATMGGGGGGGEVKRIVGERRADSGQLDRRRGGQCDRTRQEGFHFHRCSLGVPRRGWTTARPEITVGPECKISNKLLSWGKADKTTKRFSVSPISDRPRRLIQPLSAAQDPEDGRHRRRGLLASG